MPGDDARVEALRARGIDVVVAPGDHGRVDLTRLFVALAERSPPVTSLLVEGGGVLAASLLAGDHVDELVWHLAPRLFGDMGVPAVGALPRALTLPDRFHLASHELLAGGDLELRYLREAR